MEDKGNEVEEIEIALFVEVPRSAGDSESETEDEDERMESETENEDDLIEVELEALVGKFWNNNPLYISMQSEYLSIHDSITEDMDTDEVRMKMCRSKFYYI